MVNIGTDKGIYEYVNLNDKKEFQETIKTFFKEVREETNTSNGIMVQLPNKKQIFVPMTRESDGKVTFQKKNVIIEA